jgi:hypothetical protein
MSGDGFPGVEWIPAHTDRYAVMRSRKIDAIVLHITDGKAVDARQTARNVFASPKERGPMANSASNRHTTSSGGMEPSSNVCAIRISPTM